jgi:hypothetical protein
MPPFNWKRPLTSGIDVARGANGRFFTALERRPRTAVGTIGAALLAPALFDGDERGYVQTSLITTPLISAGYMALDRAMPDKTRSLPPAYANSPRARGAGEAAVDHRRARGRACQIRW